MTLEEERKALEEQRRTLEREKKEFARRVENEDRRLEQQQKILAEVFQKELIHIKLVIHKTPPVSHWAFALSCKIHYRIQGVHILS